MPTRNSTTDRDRAEGGDDAAYHRTGGWIAGRVPQVNTVDVSLFRGGLAEEIRVGVDGTDPVSFDELADFGLVRIEFE